jgi:hypothetical protein
LTYLNNDENSVRFRGKQATCAHLLRDSVAATGKFLPPPTPNIVYGHSKETLCQPNSPKLPTWLAEEAKAATDLYYPFLIIKMQSQETNFNGDSYEAINDCMVASSTCVGMIDKLNERLFEVYNGNVPERLNDAVFGIVANGGVARVYVTCAWGKNRGHTLRVASFLLKDPEHHLKLYKLVRSIVEWGNGERLREILSALRLIQLGGLRRYRYPSHDTDVPF